MTNDHDLLITLKTSVDYLIKEVQSLRDGTKKDISDLQVKVDILEKADITAMNKIDGVNLHFTEQYNGLIMRVLTLENYYKDGVYRHESNRTYIWRKALEYAVPFIFLIIGLVLAKLGILNLK